jgi:glycosyltransferase involved in cell wall biosynthesis
MSVPFISICIPAYKRVEYLKRLLESIAIQSYRDFEVIITDDSPNDEVKILSDQYVDVFPVSYFKNPQNLGTPENWNAAIRQATGEWIKLMHDDDWFTDEFSLGEFATQARTHPNNFLFSSYTNIYLEEEREEIVNPDSFRVRQLLKNPLTLLSRNIIGPPSVTMHRRQPAFYYDNKLKWLVDIDYYYARLKIERPVWIKRNLIRVGLSKDQVTAMCHRNPEVEIPENFYLLRKTGTSQLRNILVYDAWWRLFRNLGIHSDSQLERFGIFEKPPVITAILNDLNKASEQSLNKGLISKVRMAFSYFRNRKTIE